MTTSRTLWEEGTVPATRVAVLAALTTGLVVALNLALTGDVSLFFDLCFVAICVAAALLVRPHDFFAVGVLPPLLMFATVSSLAGVARDTVARAEDGMVQATVSGLAHHAGALVGGYALTLGILAVRQAVLARSKPAPVTRRGVGRATKPVEPSQPPAGPFAAPAEGRR